MSAPYVFTMREAQRLGEALNIDWKRFDVEQFHKGLHVELEHGLCDLTTNITNNNPTLTAKIVLAHLQKIPDYYTRLEIMEREVMADLRHRDTVRNRTTEDGVASF